MDLLERANEGLHDAVFSALPPLPAGSILDVGCGTGAWLSRFQGRELVGLDRDIAQVGLPGVDLIGADLDRGVPDLKDRRFAFISAIEIIEHLENPGHLIELAGRHLAADGWFLVTTPNVHAPIARLRWLLTGRLRFFDGTGEPTHIAPLITRWLEVVLPRHGLHVRRCWGVPARGTRTASLPVRIGARALDLALPRVVSGDTLCVLATKG